VICLIGELYLHIQSKADHEGFQVMEGTAWYKTEMEHSFQDINDVNCRTIFVCHCSIHQKEQDGEWDAMV
jgi:hypothetical protein